MTPVMTIRYVHVMSHRIPRLLLSGQGRNFDFPTGNDVLPSKLANEVLAERSGACVQA